MASLSLTDGTSRFELDLVRWDGDAYVSVLVDSRGYAGRNDLYILADEFVAFCRGLLEAQRTLRGAATLKSISPSELELHVRPAGSLGYFEVVGSTGYHAQSEGAVYWHAVHFGFQIEPGQLDRAVLVPWVAEYGVSD